MGLNFIEIHSNGKHFFINVNNICYVDDNDKHGCTIVTNTAHMSTIIAEESYSTVVAKISDLMWRNSKHL